MAPESQIARTVPACLSASPDSLAPDADPVEVYCEVLEHKWDLAERAQADVGHTAAVEDYLGREAGSEPPPE